MLKRTDFLPIIAGLFAITYFSCSSNREVTRPQAVQVESTYQYDSSKMKSSIEKSSSSIIWQSELSTLSGIDSLLSGDEAIGKLLDFARKHYANALAFQNSGNQDSSAMEFENAINVLNNLSYYPNIEDNKDFVDLSKKIIGDYEKYISTVQNLAPGTSVFALQDKLSEIVDSINVAGAQFPKEEIPKTTIPLEMNKYVEQNIEFFTTRGRWHMQNWIYRSGAYIPMMKKIFRDHGLPPELAYLSMPESGLNPDARSWARAVGLWQFTRGTGSLYGLHTNWWYDERRDPVKATEAAANYLKDLYNRYGDWYLVLASYDCGSVQRAIRRSHGKTNFWEIKRHLPREARNYVPQYIAVTLIALDPKAYDFDDTIAPVHEIPCDTVMIPESIDLKVLTDACGVDLDSLLNLNPELVHAVTPPNFSGDGYPLRVPAGMGKAFVHSYNSLPESAKLTWTFHTVRYGETLSGIARRYSVGLASLKLANDFSRRTRRVRAGTTLIIPVNSSYYTHRHIAKVESAGSTGPGVSAQKTNQNMASIHVVKRGETLSSIADDYGTTIAELKRINNLRRSSIRPRMRLHVPANTTEIASNSTGGQTAPAGSLKNTQPAEINAQQKVAPTVAENASVNSSSSATSVFYHRVQRGENLSQIAAIHGTTVLDLKKWNHLTSGRIRTGQRLRVIPPTAVSQAQSANTADEYPDPDVKMIYRVRHGDTLWSIAKKFGVPMDKLRKWNYIAAHDIRPGQKIVIYN